MAALILLLTRALVITVYKVGGEGLQPEFHAGDRVMVSRWSYGLRTGAEGSPFSYGRLLRQPVGVGDIVAFEHPGDKSAVLLCRCKALPGQRVMTAQGPIVLLSADDCGTENHYWLEAIGPANTTDSRTLGPIAEHLIIGRAYMVAYSHDPSQPLWRGYDANRLMLAK